jgi:hypothetical protein
MRCSLQKLEGTTGSCNRLASKWRVNSRLLPNQHKPSVCIPHHQCLPLILISSPKDSKPLFVVGKQIGRKWRPGILFPFIVCDDFTCSYVWQLTGIQKSVISYYVRPLFFNEKCLTSKHFFFFKNLVSTWCVTFLKIIDLMRLWYIRFKPNFF